MAHLLLAALEEIPPGPGQLSAAPPRPDSERFVTVAQRDEPETLLPVSLRGKLDAIAFPHVRPYPDVLYPETVGAVRFTASRPVDRAR